MKNLVICVFTVEHTDMTLNVNARGSVKRHQTENSAFFCLFYFYQGHYNKYFFKIPANQILISTYSNYSKTKP